MLNVSKNDKTKLNLRWCRKFSLLSGKSKGLQKEMRGPRLMSSFPSLHIPSSLSIRKVSHLLQSPQVLSELLAPFAAFTQSLFSAGHWMFPIPTCTREGKACGSKYGQGHIPDHFFPTTQRWLPPSEIQLETHFKAIQTQGKLNFLK